MPAIAEKPSAFKDLAKLRTVGPVVTVSEESAKRGRPTKPSAKSRDPEYRAWTGYLKKNTIVEAEYRLKIASEGRSVSELLEELLSNWVAEQPKS